MNVVLLIVGIIFLVCMIVGYRKGFLKIAVSLGITIAAIILVTMLSPYVSTWIQKSTPLVETVQNKVEDILISEGVPEEALVQVEDSREQQISLIEGGNIPKVIQEMLLSNNNNEVYQMLGVTTFVEYIGAYVAKIIADIIAFLITLIIVMILVRVIMGVIGIIGKIPVVGGVNRLAGAAVGIGVGLIIVWTLFIVVTLLYNTTFGKMCLENIAESQILTKLYDGNVLMNSITKF